MVVFGMGEIVPKTEGYCWRTYFNAIKPRFLPRLLQGLVCLQRSNMRGKIFDAYEFANSIRRFSERQTPQAPKRLPPAGRLAIMGSYSQSAHVRAEAGDDTGALK